MASIKVLIVLLIQALHIVRGEDEPKRETTNGTVIGSWQLSRNGRSFESFEGLRYAKQPGRFQRPEPPANWTGNYDASFVRSICPQLDPVNWKYYDNEDCLYLNIYVPKLNTTDPLPVMFWIHGGAFLFGAGSDLGPLYFMDEDIILVTINYRLGVFGFLNLGESVEASGNMGIRDMFQALRWTQDNIKFFGGDPDKITIFGESAGGASVHALVISPLTSGSIYRAIAQSGTMLAPWSFDKDTSTINNAYLASVGCKGENATATLNCFKDKKAKDLVKAQSLEISFVPSWDAQAIDPVFPKIPMELVQLGEHIKNINMITGFNEKEALLMAAGVVSSNATIKYFNENWSRAISVLLNLEKSLAPGYNLEQITSEIREIYLDGNNVTPESLMNLTDLISDCFFMWGAKHAAVLHARRSAKVFPYVFTYRGNFSVVNLPGYPDHGPTHADELQYLFPSRMAPNQNWPDLVEGSDDEDFSKSFIALWKSFAQDGEPDDWDVAWKPIPMDDVSNIYNPALQWYHIDEIAEQKQESYEFQRKMAFWTQTFTSSAAFITSSTFYLLAICSAVGLYLH